MYQDVGLKRNTFSTGLWRLTDLVRSFPLGRNDLQRLFARKLGADLFAVFRKTKDKTKYERWRHTSTLYVHVLPCFLSCWDFPKCETQAISKHTITAAPIERATLNVGVDWSKLIVLLDRSLTEQFRWNILKGLHFQQDYTWRKKFLSQVPMTHLNVRMRK